MIPATGLTDRTVDDPTAGKSSETRDATRDAQSGVTGDTRESKESKESREKMGEAVIEPDVKAEEVAVHQVAKKSDTKIQPTQSPISPMVSTPNFLLKTDRTEESTIVEEKESKKSHMEEPSVNARQMMEKLALRKRNSVIRKRRSKQNDKSISVRKGLDNTQKSTSSNHRSTHMEEVMAFELPQQPPVKEPEKSSFLSHWSWLKAIEFSALFYLMTDFFIFNHLYERAVYNGGLFFVMAYFFLSLCIEFPLLHLYLHISQHTKAGLTKVFGSYVYVCKGLGWSILFVIFIHHSICLQNAAQRLTGLHDIGRNPEQLISCPKVPNSSYTCTSIIHLLNCSRDTWNHSMSIDRECVHGARNVKTPIRTALQIKMEKEVVDGVDRIYTPILYAPCIGLIFAGLAFTGPAIFTMILALIGSLTILGLVIIFMSFIIAGNLFNGISMFWLVSEPESFFSMHALYHLYTFCIETTAIKFFIISYGSYRSSKKDSFYTSLTTIGGHKLLAMLCLAATLSVQGFFYQFPAQKFSGDLSYWTRTEFIVATGLPGIFVHIYTVLEFLGHCAPYSGLLYIALTIERDHFTPFLFSQQVVVMAMSVAAVGAAIILAYFKWITGTFFAILPGAAGNSVILVLFVTLFLYGEREHLIDRGSYCNTNMQKRNRFFLNQLSNFYPYYISRALPPIIMMFSSNAFVIGFMNFWHREQYKEYVLSGCIGFIPMCIFSILSLFAVKNSEFPHGESWRLYYPSTDHPSYQRIMRVFNNGQVGSTERSQLREMAQRIKRTFSGTRVEEV